MSTITQHTQHSAVRRWFIRFNAGDSRLKRFTLKFTYYVFIILPYPLRRVASAAFIIATLGVKKLTGVERQNELTPLDEVGTLSFWGVPDVDTGAATLTIAGEVERDVELRIDELIAMPTVERTVRMDCVGGFRNNTVMTGVSVAHIFELAGVRDSAVRAVFHCADGYEESIPVRELIEGEAFLAYLVNGERVDKLGNPLRLAIPGKYGYKWAKWIQRIELVADERKGYWESRGLPDRANVGDVW
ncbi:MAG: molybdopterin-dependent oxidoreductase [Chloroflexi bacterium]|nr:molybdopterin-dependent oxidoreductase [Chloroflexota bacterium]